MTIGQGKSLSDEAASGPTLQKQNAFVFLSREDFECPKPAGKIVTLLHTIHSRFLHVCMCTTYNYWLSVSAILPELIREAGV